MLAQKMSENVREFAVALAQRIAATPLADQAGQDLNNRLFRGSKLAVQLACKRELAAIRAAKRGEIFSTIAS